MTTQAQSSALNYRQKEKKHNVSIARSGPACCRALHACHLTILPMSSLTEEKTETLSNVINILYPIKKGLRLQMEYRLSPTPFPAIISWLF